MKTGDIDIDVYDRADILKGLHHTDASILRDGEHVRHNSGVYFQEIPCNPYTNISTIDHHKAEEYGYFKIDLLNNSIYKGIKDEAELNILLNTEPKWELLEHIEVVEQLAHIHNYHSLLATMKPKSIEQLAMVIAIIRPAKSHLKGRAWDEIAKSVWLKEGDGYMFKHAHAISYAAAIVVQLNKLCNLLDE